MYKYTFSIVLILCYFGLLITVYNFLEYDSLNNDYWTNIIQTFWKGYNSRPYSERKNDLLKLIIISMFNIITICLGIKQNNHNNNMQAELKDILSSQKIKLEPQEKNSIKTSSTKTSKCSVETSKYSTKISKRSTKSKCVKVWRY